MGFWYLPTLPENAVVDAAVLQMCHYSWTASTSGDAKLGMYAVENASLGGETMRNWILSRSWNNTPDIIDSVLDYQTLNSSTVNYWKNFDITRAMRTWYADSSNLPILRFRLINYADYQTMKPSLTFVAYRDAWASAQPVFYLDYRIAAGLEDYYTAENISIDRAGTAYVTDLTRNMTLVKEVASKASTAFPASVSLIYNSAYGPDNLYYATDTASAFNLGKCGKGWKLSLQQTITADANPDYLRYLDADGTIHYFKKESGSSEYKDEDGLGLTITGSSSAYTLKDAKNNQYKFNSAGLLSEILDQSGNKLTVTYNSSNQITQLDRIQNGSNVTELIATFGYHSSGYLTSITDSASRTVTLTYTSDGYLSKITHPDGTKALYTYSSDGHMISAEDNESGYEVQFTYGTDERVTGYTEYGGSSSGASVSIAGEDGLTSYRYCGKDRTLDTSDDLITNCVFDYFGRTITTYTTNANGQTIYGADAAAYTENNETDKRNNRLTTYGSLGNPAENLLSYPSLEGLSSLPSGWSFSGGGSAAVSAALPRTGEKSVLITRSSLSDADSILTIPMSGLSADTWYVFSAYVRTTDGTTTQNASSGSSLMAGNKQGEKVYWGNSGWWERLALFFKTGSSGSIDLKLKVSGMQGGISFDDLQLEKTIYGGYGGKSSVNFLRNGNTTSGGGGWSFSDSTNVYYSTAGTSPFSKVIRIIGDASAERKAYQTVKVKTPGSQTYLFSGWAKADSVVLTAGRAYELRAVITYTDNTTETHQKNFCADSTKWQYLVLPVVPKETGKTVNTIRVEAVFTANPNTADFTGFSLVREDAASYTYDEEGNLTAVKSESGDASYTYENANLIQYLSMGSGTFTYDYDDNHRLIQAKNDTLTMDVTYDAKGNTTGTSLTATGTSQSITTSATYNTPGTRLSTQTDARGKVTTYGYNNDVSKLMGAPTSVQTPGGTTYQTSYQLNNGRVSTSSIDNVITLSYAYTAGRLSSITRTPAGSSSGQTYYLTYDAYGNPTSVKVGTRTLTTNTYEANNGALASTSLGNGFTKTINSDVLERPRRITYNGSTGTALDYVYGGNGEITEKYDYLVDRIETRDYDTAGRLVNQREYSYSSGNVGYALYQSHYSYDSASRVTEHRFKSTYSGGGTSTGARYYRYNYSSVDGSLTKLTHNYYELNYGYDNLKRLESRTLKKDGTTLVTRNYSYLAGTGSGGTTFLVSSVTNEDKNGSTLRSYNYTYDDNGNIVSVSGSDPATYTYDSQNQLTSETKNGVTTSFTYDAAGNILTRTKGSVTDTYTYGNSDWKDLLTAYNGHTITYDTIGNPTTWYDGSTFTWSNGRQLTGISTGTGTNISYSYYADGRRATKTVGGVTTTFNWVGDQLFSTYQSDGTSFEFLYDENNHPVGFWYKQGSGAWNLYFYVTNLQGDITKIIDENGSSIGTYVYDAWGKVTSISGTVAQANPLRYRGYYFDQETGFYQLGSRYYAPEIGRFVNADNAGLIGANGEYISYNLFAYCLNNPVNHVDRDGMLSCEAKFAIGVGIIALAAAVTIATGGAAAGTLAASIHCFASGALVGAASGGFYGAVGGAVQGAVMHLAAKKSTRGIGKTMMEYSTEGFMSGTALGGVLGGLSSPVCFVAGTAVLGENGEVSIENIRPGDLVWSRSEETGVRTLARVLETYEKETKELVHLEIGGVRITTTPEHPFYTAKKGWTAAIELRAGDLLVLFGGEYVILEKVQHEILENPVKVYNIQVEENHTYYVSARGVLVHNHCGGETPATKRGRQAHADYDYGEGVRKEVKIGKGARVDAIDEANKIIYELKPNNPRAIRRGVKQLERYLSFFDETWKGIVLTYENR